MDPTDTKHDFIHNVVYILNKFKLKKKRNELAGDYDEVDAAREI